MTEQEEINKNGNLGCRFFIAVIASEAWQSKQYNKVDTNYVLGIMQRCMDCFVVLLLAMTAGCRVYLFLLALSCPDIVILNLIQDLISRFRGKHGMTKLDEIAGQARNDILEEHNCAQ